MDKAEKCPGGKTAEECLRCTLKRCVHEKPVKREKNQQKKTPAERVEELFREKKRAVARQWYADNKERAQQRNKMWREQNREHIREYEKKYREEHKEELLKTRRAWRARKKAEQTAQAQQKPAKAGKARGHYAPRKNKNATGADL